MIYIQPQIVTTESDLRILDLLSPNRENPAGSKFLQALQQHKPPVAIPEATRVRHHWLLGGSGHGKTQSLQTLIYQDIPRILAGECSIVVLDSQRQIIPRLAKLALWSDHPRRLMHVVPWEIEHPIALNFFKIDMPGNKQAAYELTVNLRETYRFIMSSLLKDAELTGKQGLLFDSLLMLMTVIPGATMDTYLELLTEEGFEEHREWVALLDPKAQGFFTRDYITGKRTDQYQSTREEVRRRLQQLIINPIFGGMFCQPDLSLDLYGGMQAGQMILLDTDKGVLGDTDSATMGALFIGLMYQAIMKRDPEDPRNTPCYFIIDECHEYFKHTGAQLALLLSQARKRNVGLILAHQYLQQLNAAPGLYDSIDANTAIKMVGGASRGDAKQLSDTLNCTPEFLHDPGGQGKFVTLVEQLGSGIFSAQKDIIENMPRMQAPEFEGMRQGMRNRYGVKHRPSPVPVPLPPPPVEVSREERGGYPPRIQQQAVRTPAPKPKPASPTKKRREEEESTEW